MVSMSKPKQPKDPRGCTHPKFQIYVETLLGTEQEGKMAVVRCNSCGTAVSVLPEPNTLVSSIAREVIKQLKA